MSWLRIELLRPEAWVYLLIAPAILVGGGWALVQRRARRRRVVAERHRARLFPGYSENRARARVVLATAGAALMAVSLLGPVRGYTLREVARTGFDLVVCIDTSRSMLARDLRPDRLSRAVREVSGLFDLARGDRIALVAFSGDAREVCPLTHDVVTLRALLERVGPEDNRVGGTDLGIALERALDLLDGRRGANEAIVLITDGEDLEGRGARVAEVAAERGIRVFVVGVGTSEGGKVPLVGVDGSEQFLRDAEGAEVVTRLDDASLQTLARITGGEYLSTEMSATPLEDLWRARISKTDRRVVGDGRQRIPHDRYQWTLVLALFCMLAEAGLRERRPRAQWARGEHGGAA